MGKQSGTQTSSHSPWGPAQNSLKFGLDELNRIYGNQTGRSISSPQPAFGGGALPTGGAHFNGFNNTPSTGQIPGIFNGFQPQQQPMLGQQGQQPMGQSNPFSIEEFGLLNPAAQELRATINGDRFNQNPYMDDVIARSMNDVNSNFSLHGRYGSGAHMDQLFTKAAAPIRYANYATERQNQLNAVQMAPGFEMAPYQLNSARQAAPYEQLRNYLGLVGGIAGQGGQQSQPIYSNPLAGIAGGAIAGGQLFGHWGALAGGALGGLGAIS